MTEIRRNRGKKSRAMHAVKIGVVENRVKIGVGENRGQMKIG